MTTFKNRIVMLLIMVSIMITAAWSATNYVQDGDALTLTWATTSPSANAAVVKGTTKAGGAIVGVALNGTGTAGENVQVATKGVFKVSVTASSTVGNIAVGDFIYTPISAIGVCTTDLSNINTGVLFGQALEAITATTTAGVYQTIKVLIRQPGHL